ncbi:hypothetical protein HK104_006699 [Borealophlyctis nickersoniae]|nr:hypothetical protein HK104_006699 [Borealophlyctis nickersoniae]
MPKFEIQWKADVEGITNLRPASKTDYDWRFKLKCSKCNEPNESWVVVNGGEEVEQSNSRGVANLVMKCKFCKAEGTINLDLDSLNPYTIEKSGKFAPIIRLESRGFEPTEWAPAEDFVAEGVESGTKFEGIDLSENEWAEYDEKGGNSVEILGVETKIKKI